jgi:phosphatidate cytidylyltransferase
MLKNRIVTTIWLVPILCLLIWFGEPYYTFAVGLVGFLAALEFFRLTKGIKAQGLEVFGIIWTLLLIAIKNPTVTGWITPYLDKELILPALITGGMAVSLVLLLLRKQKQGAFTDWSWTLAEILYIGWFLGYFITLRGLDGNAGRNWVFLAIFATAGSDITAFFIGSAIGKHKLAPSISPGKTWEGSIAGVLGTVGISLLFLLNTPLRLSDYVNWWQIIIIALLISVTGQLGDLVESLFKRNTGAKDSGNIFPGHGGMLDRMDSVVFATITVYYIVILFKLYS